MSYFNILFRDVPKFGVAISTRPELFILPASGDIPEWRTFDLVLETGDFTDYLANDLGCRLCSEKMRGVLAQSATALDILQWLPVRVLDRGKAVPYYLLHFPSPPSVLDPKRTQFAGDFVVKPVFDPEKAAPHGVLSYQGAGTISLIVNEATKRALEAAGCTGLEFARMAGT